MEKLIIEEDIALLQHRLTSTTAQHQSRPKLIHPMTDDMDMMLKGLNDTVEITPTACLLSNDMERLRTLKKDIIDQAIATCSKMRDNLNLIIEIEENKFSVQNRYMELGVSAFLVPECSVPRNGNAFYIAFFHRF